MTGPASPVEELAGLAVALTGSPAGAAALLGEVEVLRDRRTGEDPEPLRCLLVARFLRDRQRAGPPVPDLPVLAHLGRLRPLPRAAVVLRHGAGLTLADVARALDRPVPRVARLVAEAEAAVGLAPSAVAAALGAQPPLPAGAVAAAATRFARTRRRRRRRTVLAACTAGVLLVGSTVVPGLVEQRLAYVRPYGAWVHGFELEAGGGWRVTGRTLTADRDSMTVQHGDDRRTCLVDLLATRSELRVPAGERVRVRYRAGVLVPSSSAVGPYLWWALGPRAAVGLGCSDSAEPATLLDLAGRVRQREVPVRIPLDLSGLSRDLEPRFVSSRERSVVALVLPAGVVGRTATPVYLSVPGADRIPEDRQRRSAVEVRGQPATLDRGRNGGVALCWPVQSTSVCVSSYVFREAADPQQRRLLGRVTRIADGAVPATRLDDPTTWFDARAALPG